MSRASKLTLLGTSLFALATVAFVHHQQEAEQAVRLSLFLSLSLLLVLDILNTEYPLTSHFADKQAMHQGVIRDIEQQRIKRERQLDFAMQQELEAEYKKEQSVRDSANLEEGTGGVAAGR